MKSKAQTIPEACRTESNGLCSMNLCNIVNRFQVKRMIHFMQLYHGGYMSNDWCLQERQLDRKRESQRKKSEQWRRQRQCCHKNRIKSNKCKYETWNEKKSKTKNKRKTNSNNWKTKTKTKNKTKQNRQLANI